MNTLTYDIFDLITNPDWQERALFICLLIGLFLLGGYASLILIVLLIRKWVSVKYKQEIEVFELEKSEKMKQLAGIQAEVQDNIKMHRINIK